MIPYILDNSKTLAELINDKTNGLGSLPECTECTVTQERNGEFTLQMKVPMTAKRFDQLTVGGLIKAKVDEDSPLQIFRIFKISKPISGLVTVYANHISYDLGKTSVLPFGAVGASGAMAGLKSHMIGGDAFTFSTNIANPSSTFTNKVPQSVRSLLGGQQGSVLDVFGGEFTFDNNRVILQANRGKKTGIELRYGKNITDLKQEENIESTYTAVMPYALDSEGNAIVGTLQTMIESAEPRIMNLDLSNEFTGVGDDVTITPAMIDTRAQAYIEANNLTAPKVSITVSFVNLAQTVEYQSIAPLEKVSLCDTISVYFEKLGVSATAKVISYKYNVLRERYESLQIGEARSNLAKTISGVGEASQTAVADATAYLGGTINTFTNLIANGLGLFVTRQPVGNTGGTKLFLHNKPTLEDSQYQWTFNSNGFAVSQDYGETWSAGIDAEGNAIFNSIAANRVDAMDIYGANITGTNISGSNILFLAKDLEGNDASILATGGIYTAGGEQKGGVWFRNRDLAGNKTVGNYVINAEDFVAFADGSIALHTDDTAFLRKYDGNGGLLATVGLTSSGGLIAAAYNSGTETGSMRLSADGTIDIMNNKVHVIMSPSNGLGIWINGSGYTGLNFIDLGDGHVALGK